MTLVDDGYLLETHHEIATIEPEWDDLAERRRALPALRPGWFRAWFDGFGAGTVEIAALRRDGQLAAILPLQRIRGGVRAAANWHTPEFDILALDPDAAGMLVEALLRSRPRSLSLSFVALSGETLAAAAAAATRSRFDVLVRTIERTPSIDLDEGWESFQSSLDAKARADLRRRWRRLRERGTVSVDLTDGRRSLDELLAEGFAVETAGWKGRAGTAVASRENTLRFYAAIAHWAAPQGWLQLAFLRLDGRAIAFEFNLEAERVHQRLKGGYDEEFQRYAPSKLLQHAVLENCFARGFERYDFLGADEPYKLDWANRIRNLALLQAFAPSVPGRVEYSVYRYGRPLAKKALALARR